MMKKYLVLLPVMALTLAACNYGKPAGDEYMVETETSMVKDDTTMEEGVMVGGAAMVPSKDIVDNASYSNEHTTLVTAVQTAGLAETLKGPGPFTVFAPTDAAFEKLPTGTVDGLLQPAQKDTLVNILTYHVVPGRYTSADLKDGMVLTTVQGQDLTVGYKDGRWMINGAMVTTPDVVSKNGVTFVIDSVLMPKQ